MSPANFACIKMYSKQTHEREREKEREGRGLCTCLVTSLFEAEYAKDTLHMMKIIREQKNM